MLAAGGSIEEAINRMRRGLATKRATGAEIKVPYYPGLLAEAHRRYMSIRDALLPEFDHEIGTTRKLLERVPEDKWDWTPHEKSMKWRRLPRGGDAAVRRRGRNHPIASISAKGGYQLIDAPGRQQLLEAFDKLGSRGSRRDCRVER